MLTTIAWRTLLVLTTLDTVFKLLEDESSTADSSQEFDKCYCQSNTVSRNHTLLVKGS